MGSTSSPCHVAVLAFPFGTHAAPLYSLASALASTVDDSGVIFSFFTSTRSASSLPPVPRIKIFSVSDGTPPGHVAVHEPPHLEVGRFMSKVPTNFTDALDASVTDSGGIDVTCLISDAFLSFGGAIAKKLNVPWVAVWTGGPCSLSAHIHTDLLRRKNLSDEDDLGFITGLSGLRIKDLPDGVVVGDLTQGFPKLLHDMALALPDADVVVSNTFQGLDPDLDSDFGSKFKMYYPVGPLSLLNPVQAVSEDRFGCIKWLEQQKPHSVVYVSFGTVVSLPGTELAELAHGLVSSGVHFIWSLKDSFREFLPDGFLDRTKDQGIVAAWVPQAEVLAHKSTGAFVTHCGWNSVLESITGGVPLVCRPVLGDQPVNARVVTKVWKVGVGFEGKGIESGELVKCLRKVIRGEEGEGMRERMRRLKEMALGAVGVEGNSVRNLKAVMEMVVGKSGRV
uniref:Glycosyltransferase n=1 Tax=Allium cepa TaxID=4679 RepID=A0A2H5AHV5_ALLCE|nr:UDP glucose-flavonoid 3-O-glucosyltransferase [Allium cepa]